MKVENNSDLNQTMGADTIFDDLIDMIRNSCLNYQVQMSPFSAVISIKKSFIKNRNGCCIIPTSSSTVTKAKKTEDALKTLEIKHDELLKTIVSENEKYQHELQLKNDHIKKVESENEQLRALLVAKDDEYRNKLAHQNELISKLNSELQESNAMLCQQIQIIEYERCQLRNVKSELYWALEEKVQLTRSLEDKCEEAIRVTKHYSDHSKGLWNSVSLLSHMQHTFYENIPQSNMSISSMISHCVANPCAYDNNSCATEETLELAKCMEDTLHRMLESFARLEEKFSDNG